MQDNIYPIGSISIFTNISNDQRYYFDSALNEKVSVALTKWFEQKLLDQFDGLKIVIINYETSVGCIITVVSVGIWESIKAVGLVGVAGAVATGTYKIVTDYDKVKKNLSSICDDISKLWLRITHRKNLDKTPSVHEIEIFEKIPDEYKEVYNAGNKIVFIKETEITTIHKVCVMRNDISEETIDERIEKTITKTIIDKSE